MLTVLHEHLAVHEGPRVAPGALHEPTRAGREVLVEDGPVEDDGAIGGLDEIEVRLDLTGAGLEQSGPRRGTVAGSISR